MDKKENRKSYPSDVTDKRWKKIEPLYRGTFVNDIKNQVVMEVDISEKIKPHSWQTIPWSWIVERTFSWLIYSRRLSKDYKISSISSYIMLIIFHIHILLNRL